MGAFNEVIVDGTPPIRVQFKHAKSWQYVYRIGDKVSWDGIERPASASGTLTVPGLASDSSVQGGFRYFAVEIDNDTIRSVGEISEAQFEELNRN